MSEREWKPGDIAMIHTKGGDGREVLGLRDEHGWAHLKDYESALRAHSRWSNASQVTVVRPLVVIDAESRDQVERLARAYADTWKGGGRSSETTDEIVARQMQAALREFAKPTPPRPDEPLGLGAVVEDDGGRRWVRVDDEEPAWRCNGDAIWDSYDDIAAVKILSEGVS